ncbi:MAG: hypothetical protein JNL11_03420 [Bdellovibrionaceae bacterium]|nr:hypothetical protein [Pseudobdellovibrionaceae bacterium]
MKIIILLLAVATISYASCDTYRISEKRVRDEGKKHKAEKIYTSRGGGPVGGIHVYTFLLALPKNKNMLATVQVNESSCEIVADNYAVPEEI